MERKKKHFSKLLKKIMAVALTCALTLGMANVPGWNQPGEVLGATTAITSMSYYPGENGPTITHSAVGKASYGFVMPKFNGKESSELSIADVEKDLQVYVRQQEGYKGTVEKIEDVEYFKWNDTWAGSTKGWGGWVCWMKLTETTELKFHGKTNDVDLIYNLVLNKLDKLKLTSITNNRGKYNS